MSSWTFISALVHTTKLFPRDSYVDWLPRSLSILTALCFRNLLRRVGEEGRSREVGVLLPESPLLPLPILLWGESTLREDMSPRMNRSSLSRQAS